MTIQCQSLRDTRGNGIDIPDAWFGCNSANGDELYNYLSMLGPQGRKAYLNINTLDFVIYMPSYALLLRTLILRQCRWQAGISKTSSWISNGVGIVVCFDVVESLIFGYATRQFPNRLDSSLLMIASIANQGKWMSLLLGMITLAVLCVRNYYVLGIGDAKGHQS